jgi:hypothetical protein
LCVPVVIIDSVVIHVKKYQSEGVNSGNHLKWYDKNDLSVIHIKNNNDNVNVYGKLGDNVVICG